MEKKTKSKKNKKGVCEMTVMNKQNIGVLKVCASKHSSSLRLGGRRGGGMGRAAAAVTERVMMILTARILWTSSIHPRSGSGTSSSHTVAALGGLPAHAVR